MKQILILLTLLLSSSFLQAQTKDTPLDELIKMEAYSKDPDAEAVIIYDLGDSYFQDIDNGFEVYFKRKCRLKILSPAGLKFAEIAIPLYVKEFEFEELIDFSAVIYNNVNGTVITTMASKKDFFEEKINDSWIQKKIALPGVKVGSVIEFEYTLSSPFLFNIQDWEFQHEIPVIYSEYVARMIPFYAYSYITIGTPKFDEFTSYQSPGLSRRFQNIEYHDMIYKFVMKDLPAFRDLDFISTPSDYKIKLDFQLSTINRMDGATINIMTTWPKMITDLNKNSNFGAYVRACKGEAKKVIKAQFPFAGNNIETLKKIVQFVKEKYNWDESNGLFAKSNAREFVKQKLGNTANINLFLTSLLQQAGINAYPVIISTRDHGKIYADYPFSHFFNYVVVRTEIDGKTYLSDATEKMTIFDQLPERCINDKGLVIKAKEENWVPLTTTLPSLEENKFLYTFNKTKDSLICFYTLTATEYDGITKKKQYLKDNQAYISETFESSFDQIDETKVMASGATKNFTSQCTGKIKPTAVENYISFNPFLNFGIDENPFNKKSRLYNIDLIYARKRNFEATILLPENAKPINLPKNMAINNNDFSMNYNISISDNALKINAGYFLKEPVYGPEMYIKLQSFIDSVIKEMNQNVQIQL